MQLFQERTGGPAETPGLDPRLVLDDGADRALACSACRARITSRAMRIEIGGAHEHSCTNPHGYRYLIGCFAAAEGLVPLGEPTLEYTWFPGRTWQVQNCAACDYLLGWRFQGPDGGFFGLILNHLVELEEPGA